MHKKKPRDRGPVVHFPFCTFCDLYIFRVVYILRCVHYVPKGGAVAKKSRKYIQVTQIILLFLNIF